MEHLKLYLTAWIWVFVMAGMFYILTQSIWKSALMMAGCSVFCLLLYIQNNIYRQYTTELVMQLDTLLDRLIRIEKEPVFSENKENLASKLQNKIFRLLCHL